MDSDIVEAGRLLNSLIIVVDDVELNRKMLTHSLTSQGYTNVVAAVDGSQALQMTHDLKPDLVILDLMMPTMDGFAYCQAIRQDKEFDNMPIIVQTALHDIEQKLRAFKSGASDYICKPVDPGELAARTRVHLSQKLLMQDLRTYRQRVSTELDSARIMQDRLMPGRHQIDMCERVFGMKIASHVEMSSALGGDCWGMRPLSDHRLAIYMFDFSGHGMSAALNVFRMHTIMHECMHAGGEPGNFLSTLNRRLHPLLERDEFATMFYGIIDTDANCLLYASAAVPPALVLSPGMEPAVLNGRGFPLGVLDNASYDTKYIPFTFENLLLLYSDSVVEAKNAAGEFLSEEKMRGDLQAMLAAKPKNPAKETADAVVKRLKQHAAGQPIEDDITINAYWRGPKSDE